MIYFIILILLLSCIYRYDYRRRRKGRVFMLIVAWVLMVFTAGLRYRIGIDSIRYEEYYPGWPTLWQLADFHYDWVRFDPGFIMLASIPRSLSDSFVLMQFFEAIVIISAVMWFALKNTRNVFLCLSFFFVMLYLNFTCEVMREAFAVSAFLFAWPLIRDGKWGWYMLVAALCMFVHTSAFFTFLVPIFFLPGVRQAFIFGKRTFYIICGLLAAGYVLQLVFFDWFMLISVTDRMMDRAKVYSETDLAGDTFNLMGVVGHCISYLIYPILALYFLHKRKRQMTPEERKEGWKWEVMTMVGVYVSVLSIPIFIMSRYYNYFGMYMLCTVATWAFTPMKIGRKNIKLRPAYWSLIFLPWFLFQIYSYTGPANKSGSLKTYMKYYPYYSRLNPQKDLDREALIQYLK